MTDLGLFPEKTSRGVAGPVTLNPYQPRAAIAYREMTDDEIIAGAGGTLIFDVECFANYFLIAFKGIVGGGVVLFEFPIDVKKLSWMAKNYTLVGFNSLKYDVPLLWAACSGLTQERLKELSDDLIGGMRARDAERKYGFSIPSTFQIDLINVCPLRGSLKLYGARLHAPRIQDVPWAGERVLDDWQIAVTRDYCINDLTLTGLIYGELSEQLALRQSLGKEYGLDFMSKGDAQIAEDVIVSELRKINGRASRVAVQIGAVHRYVPPENLSFRSKHMRDVLRVVTEAEFVVDAKGYLICPATVSDMNVEIGGSIYRMGIGGLHSSETCVSIVADDEFELADFDVNSYYPNIILNCELSPRSLGQDFLTVYRSLVERRLSAKAKSTELKKQIDNLEKRLATMPE